MLQTLSNSTARTQILQFERPYVPNQPKRPFFLNNSEFYIIPNAGCYQTLEELLRPSGGNSEFVTTSEKTVNLIPAGLKPFSGPLTQEQRERLLGKAPLRLVMARSPQFIPPSTTPKYWIETLECGHTTEAFPLSYWDEGGHLITSEPTAKRRRCQPCKQIQLGIKKDSQSVKFSQDSQVPVVGKKESK